MGATHCDIPNNSLGPRLRLLHQHKPCSHVKYEGGSIGVDPAVGHASITGMGMAPLKGSKTLIHGIAVPLAIDSPSKQETIAPPITGPCCQYHLSSSFSEREHTIIK